MFVQVLQAALLIDGAEFKAGHIPYNVVPGRTS